VIISRTMLGSFKVLQRFPLTDDGWAKAWPVRPGVCAAGRGWHREPATPASPVEDLTKLASLLQSGQLTREEFDRLKARLLADS